MSASDVNTDLKIMATDVEMICGLPKKIAIIYMHAVSDAQYFYGTDCFFDLDDWLKYSIQELVNLDLTVIVKLHPSYFSYLHNYPADINYFHHIREFYGFDYSAKDSGRIINTNTTGLYFMGHQICIKEIKDAFGCHITITHHGSIAVESAYMGIPVVASVSSPYIKDFDTFVSLYETKNEYITIVKNWINTGQMAVDHDCKSLLRYIDHNLIRRKEFHVEGLLGKQLGVNPASGMFSILVEDALNALEIESDKFEECRRVMESLVEGLGA
jgi:hypothetical protein